MKVTCAQFGLSRSIALSQTGAGQKGARGDTTNDVTALRGSLRTRREERELKASAPGQVSDQPISLSHTDPTALPALPHSAGQLDAS